MKDKRGYSRHINSINLYLHFKSTMMNDLSDRLLRFSVSVITLMRRMPASSEYSIIKKQLIRSATSSGANYQESQGGCSKADFLNKVKIALKEMRESNYWLIILKEITIREDLVAECYKLISESNELKNILGAICAKVEQGQD